MRVCEGTLGYPSEEVSLIFLIFYLYYCYYFKATVGFSTVEDFAEFSLGTCGDSDRSVRFLSSRLEDLRLTMEDVPLKILRKQAINAYLLSNNKGKGTTTRNTKQVTRSCSREVWAEMNGC